MLACNVLITHKNCSGQIQDYLAENNIFSTEEKGNKRKSRDAEDQFLIDKIVLENFKS